MNETDVIAITDKPVSGYTSVEVGTFDFLRLVLGYLMPGRGYRIVASEAWEGARAWVDESISIFTTDPYVEDREPLRRISGSADKMLTRAAIRSVEAEERKRQKDRSDPFYTLSPAERDDLFRECRTLLADAGGPDDYQQTQSKDGLLLPKHPNARYKLLNELGCRDNMGPDVVPGDGFGLPEPEVETTPEAAPPGCHNPIVVDGVEYTDTLEYRALGPS